MGTKDWKLINQMASPKELKRGLNLITTLTRVNWEEWVIKVQITKRRNGSEFLGG